MAEPRVIYAEDYTGTASQLLKQLNVKPINTNVRQQTPEAIPSGPRVIYADEYGTDTIVPQEDGGFVDLNYIFEEYGKKLTKEDIVADERLMDVIRSNLEARFTPGGGALTKAGRGLTALSGGAIGGLSKDYRSMSDEDAFETWQNYQRSFAGGQTITTVNEVAYGMSADDSTRAKLGAGYMLMDQMDNAITGEGSWSEMGDAIFDYTKAAVYDPSTVLSFGLGKLLGFGATKASGLALRTLMSKAYQGQIKKGVATETAKRTIGTAVAKSLPIAIADGLIGAGVDVGYQMQLIKTDAQEDFSKAQLALSAAGSMIVIPTLVGMSASIKQFRKRDLAPQFLAYKQVDADALKLGPEEAQKLLDDRVNKQIVNDSTNKNFEITAGDSREFLNWEDAKVQAGQGIEARGEELIDDELVDSFFKRFWFGNEEEGITGYYVALKEAGFVVHPSMLVARNDKKKNRTVGGSITNVFGQAIEYLSDKSVKKAMKNFEKSTGKKLGIKYTAFALSENFIKRTSTAGSILWTPSQISRLEKAGVKPKDATDILGNKRAKPEELPARFQYTMSVYKRLLTSHLSTTGANLKGFAQLVSINTAADFFTAAVNMTQGATYKYIRGDEEKALKFYNRAYGSALGAVRRGADLFSPDILMETADAVLSTTPEITAKLFRDVAGDGGVRDAISDFNLDKVTKGEKLVWGSIDAVTKGAQTLSGVRLQDDITKRIAFGSNVNQAIMRAYGVQPEVFFARIDAALEMASDKFKEEVLEKAVFRTMRETASVNWSTLPGREGLSSARTWAKKLEYFTNNTPGGFIIPFGSFLNTTIATMSDLTGINAMRFAIKNVTGQELDFATREGADALGKMAAGWSIIGIGVYGLPGISGGAKERIENNLAYNQELKDDGSIEDKKYDWPGSTIRLMSQISAHALGDGESISDMSWDNIPSDLLSELALQVGGQSIRDLDKFGQSLVYAAEQLGDKNLQPLQGLVGAAIERAVQGATRPLDPINQVWGLVSDGNMNPDLRQGGFMQGEILRYINNITDSIGGGSSLPKKATPTRGVLKTKDIGKQVLGVRGLSTPNLIEQMMNSAGKPYWKAIRFDGPPEIKNKMDAVASPFFEAIAIKYLRNNPDYFKKPQREKEEILDRISKEVRAGVMEVVEKGMPRSINLVRVLSRENKKEVQKVMEFLNIEESLEELLKKDDGLQTLLKIKTLLDNYDDIFFGDIK